MYLDLADLYVRTGETDANQVFCGMYVKGITFTQCKLEPTFPEGSVKNAQNISLYEEINLKVYILPNFLCADFYFPDSFHLTRKTS